MHLSLLCLVGTAVGYVNSNGYEGFGSDNYRGPYGGEYGGLPMYPQIPFLTLPQRIAGRPLYIPNPPVYASGISNEQNQAYLRYRFDFFYNATVAATPAPDIAGTNITQPTDAPPMTLPTKLPTPSPETEPSELSELTTATESTVREKVTPIKRRKFNAVLAQNGGQECIALSAKSSDGSTKGTCMAETLVSRNCPSGLSSDGKGCNSNQRCCIMQNSRPKEVEEFLKRLGSKKL